MLGLSLTPPWPWAILECGKRIENRVRWRGCAYRGLVALHASNPPNLVGAYLKKMAHPEAMPTERQQEAVAEFMDIQSQCRTLALKVPLVPKPVTLEQLCQMSGHIVGTARLVGTVSPEGRVEVRGQAPRELTEIERDWWQGGFALVLDEVRKLRVPVPRKGALGLWPIPQNVVNEVRRNAI